MYEPSPRSLEVVTGGHTTVAKPSDAACQTWARCKTNTLVSPCQSRRTVARPKCISSETTCLQNVQNVDSVICVPYSRNLLESTSCHLKRPRDKENVIQERLVLPYQMNAVLAYVKSTPPRYVNNCGRHRVGMALLCTFVANIHVKECPRSNIVSSQTERNEGEKTQVPPFGSGGVTITALQR